MRRLLPLAFFLVLLADLPAAQEPKPPKPPAEVKAYPTLAPGHHVGPINAMVFTPDGKRLITGGEDRTIQVWDVATGQRVKLFRPPVGPNTAGAINSLALAPDGKTLAVTADPIPVPDQKGTSTNLAYLLHLDDGRIRVLDGPFSQGGTKNQSESSVAFSKDGRQLALSANTGTVLYTELADVWADHRTPLKHSRQFDKTLPRLQIAFSPTGEHLLAIYRSLAKTNPLSIRIWDIKTGKMTPAAFGLNSPLAGAWSPAGDKILTVHRFSDSAQLKVWSPAGGEPLQTFTAQQLGGTRGVVCDFVHIAHHSGTKYLLAGDEKTRHMAVLFDLETGKGKVVASVGGVSPGMAVGAVSPDGERAAFTTAPLNQRVALLDLKTADRLDLGGPAELNRLAGWTANGNSITWGHKRKGGAEIATGLNLRTLERIDVVREPITHATINRDGHALTTAAKKLVLTRGDAKLTLLPTAGPTAVYTLPGSGQIEWVAIGTQTGLHRHAASTGLFVHTFEPAGQRVTSVVSSPDGKYLFTTSELGVMRIYNPAEVKPLLNAYMEDTDWIAWTEEGYYAASPNGERLIGWTINQGLNREANLLPAEQFRATLYRPDVIKLLLDKGSVAEALKAANAARKVGGIAIPRGVADPEKLLPAIVSLKVDDRALPKAVVTVEARAGCKEQPIKSLRLLVDGRPLPGGVARVSYDTEKAESSETWTVELPPGKHRLSVLARSKDDTPSISSPVLVDTPLPPEMRPLVHHVAVGVSKYADDKLNLNFAEKDALDLAGAIRTSCAGTIYQKVETTSLTNNAARSDAVLKALDDTRKVAKSTDLLILSFAGHGIREDGEFYLLTHEADTKDLAKTTISGAALRAKLADYPCQVLLLLDACHSGAFVPLAKFKPATDEAARALADVEMRVAVMCAAQGHEEALEAKGNGHFTAAVIRALNRDPKAFFDLDTGELSVYHLQAFVSQEVSKATEFRQNPYLKMPLAHPPVIVTRFPMK